MTTSPSAVVQIEPDRWIVRDRESQLIGLLPQLDGGIRLEFDSALSIAITGEWSATIGSPRTGPAADLADGSDHVGATLLSLVLFESGAMRAVLSDGLILAAQGAIGTTIESTQPGAFAWISRDGVIARRRFVARE